MHSGGSSIFDLKAELTRREEEVSKTKTTKCNDDVKKERGKNKTFQKIRGITGDKKKKKKKNKVGDWKESDEDDNSHTARISDELQEMYSKSQQKLIAKSKLYEKMQKGEIEDVEDYKGETRYLVDFDKKYYDKETIGSNTINQSKASTTLSNSSASVLNAELDTERREIAAENIYEADLEHREKLHEKWRQEQDEILEGPVHYENIKFDEIRDLGTGYYAFSKNEDERKQQMDDLKKMREQTLSAHKKKELLQKKRKAALDARLMKVKRRKAEDEGRLDEFLEEEERKAKQHQDQEDSLAAQGVDYSDEHKNNANSISGLCETAQTSRTTDEMLKECRNSADQTREWDKGKQSGFVGQPFIKGEKQQQQQQQQQQTKQHYSKVPSYEKRLENLRKERPEDFAPPNFY